MKKVRVGVIGLGSAGSLHARALAEGKVPGAALTAVVCQSSRLQDISPLLPLDVRQNLRRYDTLDALIRDRSCEAVIIATPHLQHPALTIAALQGGLHVLCEKPAGVRTREAREMAETAQQTGLVYALNYSRRTMPVYRTIRDRVQSGEIGSVRRILWTSTDWLRVQAYYGSSSWRGTWAGEGGGILLNQWPHLLDLWHWIFGMPARLNASCGFGKRHDIEVEDEVTVFAEYANGASAVLIGSTGEAPGTERIEILGDRGRIVADGDQIRVTRLQSGSVDDFITGARAGFSQPEYVEEVFPASGEGDLITGITKNFVEAIIAGGKLNLIAPGAEGVSSLMLANAILLSAWQDAAWISLPMSDAAQVQFEALLDDRMASSKTRAAAPSTAFALEESFRS